MRLQNGVYIDDVTTAYRLNQSIPASFTVWKDDNVSPILYRAESNLEGVDDISGTVAATVINAASVNGGKIFLSEGTYTITASLYPKSDIVFEGAGPNTILNLTAATPCIRLDAVNEVTLRNFAIKTNVAGSYGVRFSQSGHNMLESIKVTGSNTATGSDNSAGFDITNESHWNTLLGCSATNIEYGFRVAALCDDNVFLHPFVQNYCRYAMFLATGANYQTVISPSIDIIMDNGVAIGIDVYGYGNKFYGGYIENMVTPPYGVGIQCEAASFGNSFRDVGLITNLPVSGWNTPFYNIGVGNRLFSISGFVTENSGTATIANGTASIAVTHGLAGAPTSIRVTGTHTEVDLLYVDTVGAVQFTIHASDGNTSADRTVYWEAEYAP